MWFFGLLLTALFFLVVAVVLIRFTLRHQTQQRLMLMPVWAGLGVELIWLGVPTWELLFKADDLWQGAQIVRHTMIGNVMTSVYLAFWIMGFLWISRVFRCAGVKA